jgi:hypothetical protein
MQAGEPWQCPRHDDFDIQGTSTCIARRFLRAYQYRSLKDRSEVKCRLNCWGETPVLTLKALVKFEAFAYPSANAMSVMDSSAHCKWFMAL